MIFYNIYVKGDAEGRQAGVLKLVCFVYYVGFEEARFIEIEGSTILFPWKPFTSHNVYKILLYYIILVLHPPDNTV